MAAPNQPGSRWGTAGFMSYSMVGAFLVWSVIAAILRDWDQCFGAGVTAGGLGLLAVIGGKQHGFIAPIIGDDNRVSTGKTQIAIWTVAVAWAVAYLLGRVLFVPNVDLKTALPDSRWDQYLVLLGGPFAAGVIAKGVTNWRVQNGTLHKTTSTDAPDITQLVQNDSQQTDLVDSQYLLFNVVALIYMLVQIARTPVLPDIPATLLALTSGAAAFYVSNKAVTTNKPSITGVTPGAVRPGDQLRITGRNFVADGGEGKAGVTVQMVNGNPLLVDQAQTSDTLIVATLGAGAPSGGQTITVTSAQGITTDPWNVQVVPDVPQLLGVLEPVATADGPLHVYGRFLTSKLTPDATEASVVFAGTTMRTGAVSPAPLGGDLQQVVVSVPHLEGTQVILQVVTAAGTRSDPLTVPLKQ